MEPRWNMKNNSRVTEKESEQKNVCVRVWERGWWEGDQMRERECFATISLQFSARKRRKHPSIAYTKIVFLFRSTISNPSTISDSAPCGHGPVRVSDVWLHRVSRPHAAAAAECWCVWRNSERIFVTLLLLLQNLMKSYGQENAPALIMYTHLLIKLFVFEPCLPL